MRIEVTGKRLDVTAPIREHAETKCQKLLKFFDGVMEIDVVLDTAEHGEFSAELVVDAVKHDPFVCHARGPNIYGCIDQCVDKMSRQLTDFKEKLRNVKR